MVYQSLPKFKTLFWKNFWNEKIYLQIKIDMKNKILEAILIIDSLKYNMYFLFWQYIFIIKFKLHRLLWDTISKKIFNNFHQHQGNIIVKDILYKNHNFHCNNEKQQKYQRNRLFYKKTAIKSLFCILANDNFIRRWVFIHYLNVMKCNYTKKIWLFLLLRAFKSCEKKVKKTDFRVFQK